MLLFLIYLWFNIRNWYFHRLFRCKIRLYPSGAKKMGKIHLQTWVPIDLYCKCLQVLVFQISCFVHNLHYLFAYLPHYTEMGHRKSFWGTSDVSNVSHGLIWYESIWVSQFSDSLLIVDVENNLWLCMS